MGTKKNTRHNISIGEVYLVNFAGSGTEQQGVRPCVIFQNAVGNEHSPNVVVLPITSAIKHTGQPTHVVLPASETGLMYDSMVLCENPNTLSKSKLGRYLTTIPHKYLKQIAEAQVLASSAIAFLDAERLVKVWEKSQTLNTVA